MSAEWKDKGAFKLRCKQLFMTEAKDDVTHNRCPWRKCTNVVCWVQGQKNGDRPFGYDLITNQGLTDMCSWSLLPMTGLLEESC